MDANLYVKGLNTQRPAYYFKQMKMVTAFLPPTGMPIRSETEPPAVDPALSLSVGPRFLNNILQKESSWEPSAFRASANKKLESNSIYF